MMNKHMRIKALASQARSIQARGGSSAGTSFGGLFGLKVEGFSLLTVLGSVGFVPRANPPILKVKG